MKAFLRIFALITAWPVQFIFFKKKRYYESEKAKKKIKGGAILLSNHTNFLFDYVMNMFSVAMRKLYCLVAEVVYSRGFMLRFILDSLGGIRVDRDSKDLSFVDKAVGVLKRGKLLQIFPEGKVEKDKKLTEFKNTYVYIALKSGKPIIPVITDGTYNLFKRTRVIYGDPIYLSDYYTGENPTGEDVVRLNEIVYEKVKKLKRRLDTLSREDKERTTFFDKLNWDFGRIVTFTFNLGLKIRVHCTDKKKTALKTKGAYVIVANHIGLFDPIKIICVFYRRRIRILTASVVFENKKFRETMMTKLGCIRLDRDKNDVASFKKCIKSLDEGYPLLVFPEGHIVKGGERTDYKSGAGLLSAMTGAPILPVYIKKREHWYNRTNVYVGDVTHLEGAGGMPAMTMLEEYNKTIAAKIDALRVKAENDEKKRNFNKT